MKNIKLLLSLYGPTLLILVLSLNANAQCNQSDIVISTNTTWTNQDVQLTDNQKITVIGATLTLNNCTLRRKVGCSGYWDGIYLATTELGAKAGLIVNNGSRIEFSRNGIQALDGFSQITLDNVEMSDNGRMILARDNWPFASLSSGGGGFTSNSSGSRDGEPTSPYAIGCDLITPSPPKVKVLNGSVLQVTENGNASVDPAKFLSQISTLGAELQVIGSDILNGQSSFIVAAIVSSRGKCKIHGDSIDGFWTGVYKGTDAAALCSSEGIVLTGSKILNTDLVNIGIGPGYAIYNVSSNALIRGNVLEANIWSFGTNYGSLMRNNIINGHDAQVERVSVFVVDPKVSFRIYDNKLTEMFMEFDHNNSKTYVTCNEWYDETYAFVGGLLTQYPLSWGTASRAAGNRWDVTKSEMYNLSSLDSDLDYYYRAVSNETFNYYDGIDDHVSSFENATCTYTWPTLYTELDPSEYVVDIEDLEDEYDSLQSEIESIIGHMDTTVLSVKEELAYLRSLLSDLVGQGLLFHTSLDSGFWTNEVDLKVVELLGLNHLWYGMDMYSITEHLDSNPDPDAEALYDAAEKMSEYFDGGKNLINLTTLQVDTLQTIAESSFGDYTNILRNYLFVMYDVFVPWLIENPMDSLMRKTPIVQTPIGSPIETITYHTLSPNPFTDYIRIQRKNIIQEQGDNHIYVYNLEGVLLHSTLFDENSGAINLSDLEPGFYILTIENTTSGSIETKRIYKVRK